MNLQLENLRKAAGYKTRKSFADAFGVNERQIKAWECGERKLRLSDACELASFLHCTLDELAGREVTPEMKRNSREAQALLDARNALDKVIQDSGYENLGDALYVDEDGAADEDNDTLSDGCGGGRGKSMLDIVDEISSGEY